LPDEGIGRILKAMDPIRIGQLDHIAAIPSADWDAAAGRANPFLSHAFLAALEASESVTPATGWMPRHLVARHEDGRVLGVAPLYLKGHSFGEYVFDFEWAAAFEDAGGRYYPKLQACIPFTPVTGPRLLVRQGPADEMAAARQALAKAMVDLAREMGLSSLHVTFSTEEEANYLNELGFLLRTGLQFHWQNEGYADFDDFLDRLTARKRKALRRERREAVCNGIHLRTLRRSDIRPHHWDAFYRFYRSTVDSKWGDAYLTPRFFHLLGETMADRIVLMLAERQGEPIAGALNFLGEDTLYGRYWGACEPLPFLHFELCYYQAIAFAIEAGLARVEAGAQGPHKVQRGYLPVPTYSAHWIAHAGFRAAIDDFLKRERRAIAGEIARFAAMSPFREDG